MRIRGKQPLSQGWASAPFPSQDDIHTLFGHVTSRHGIGIRTGAISNLLVIDIDNKEGAANAIYDEFYAQYPTNCIVRTGGGGWHLYYNYIAGVKNQVKVQNVDVRSDGGLVVAPPSSHSSGGIYEWVTEGEPGEPLWAYDIASHTVAKNVLVGTRNDSLTRYVGGVLAGNPSIENAMMAALVWNQDNCSPPLTAAEVRSIVKSIHKIEHSKHTHKVVLSSAAPQFLTSAQARDSMTLGGEEWLIDNIWAAHTLGFMVGEPGCYKSWLMADLAVSRATKTSFVDKFAVRPGATLILHEDTNNLWEVRMHTILHGKKNSPVVFHNDSSGENILDIAVQQLPPSVKHASLSSNPFRLDADDAVNLLQQCILQYGTPTDTLVILDALYDLVALKDNLSESPTYLSKLKALRDELKCHFIIVHHTRKSQSNMPDRADTLGSTLINAVAEASMQIRRTSDRKVIQAACYGKNLPETSNFCLEFEIPQQASEVYKVKYTNGSGIRYDIKSAISNGLSSVRAIAIEFKMPFKEVAGIVDSMVVDGTINRGGTGKLSYNTSISEATQEEIF